MLPMLRMTSDGAAHRILDLVGSLSNEFRLTEAEREQRISSGQRVIYNRTHWAATYLAKAQLLHRVARGSVQLTARGQEVLASNPARVDVRLLSQFPEFAAFRARTAAPVEDPKGEAARQDPEELLDTTFGSLRRTVEADLLDHVLVPGPASKCCARSTVRSIGSVGERRSRPNRRGVGPPGARPKGQDARRGTPSRLSPALAWRSRLGCSGIAPGTLLRSS
jgi:hypothetical protein